MLFMKLCLLTYSAKAFIDIAAVWLASTLTFTYISCNCKCGGLFPALQTWLVQRPVNRFSCVACAFEMGIDVRLSTLNNEQWFFYVSSKRRDKILVLFICHNGGHCIACLIFWYCECVSCTIDSIRRHKVWLSKLWPSGYLRPTVHLLVARAEITFDTARSVI